MSNQYPPSSPTSYSTARYATERGAFTNEDDTDQHDFSDLSFNILPIHKGNKLFKNVDFVPGSADDNQYPTPNPSSSIGITPSSPARNSNTIPSRATTIESSSLNIQLDPNNASRLSVGRKRSVCDIVLPNLKNVSRQHAFLTYLNDTNEIKIECTGTNGIIVLLPNNGIDCYLERKSGSQNVFQLCLKDKIILNEVFITTENNKQLMKSQHLTSFVLMKGETVIMPFIDNTKVDFRQAEISLSLKNSDLSNDDNSTEAEDEMTVLQMNSELFESTVETPSKKFVPVAPSSSSTEQINMSKNLIYKTARNSVVAINTDTTPRSSMIVTEPETPKKIKKEIFRKMNFETPVPDHNNNTESVALKNSLSLHNRSTLTSSVEDFEISNVKRQKIAELQHTDSDMSSTPKLQLPIQTPTLQKKKKKLTNNLLQAHRGIAIEDLNKKGIDCQKIQHILSNHLAFSMAQQTPLSLLRDISKIVSTLEDDELRVLLENEKSIGVIARHGKDAAGKALEQEYYYDLENDYDEDRKNLVISLKGGRTGLRSTRKIHKQYYWKKPAKKSK